MRKTSGLKMSTMKVTGTISISEGDHQGVRFVTLEKVKMSQSGIYQIINHANGKYYIGQSRDLIRRREDHFRKLAQGKFEGKDLQQDYNKYGDDSFEFLVVLYCRPSELTFWENVIINNLHPIYNRKQDHNGNFEADGEFIVM